MGRTARGVRGITLSEGDYVVGVAVVDDSKKLLTITERGLGKRTEFSDFREMKHRGGKGVACHKISDKSGNLAAIATVSDDDDLMIITNSGTIIRMSVSDVNVYSRTASGVIVMRLSDDSSIVTASRLEKSEEIEEESKKVDAENASAEVAAAPEKPDETNVDDTETEEENS